MEEKGEEILVWRKRNKKHPRENRQKEKKE